MKRSHVLYLLGLLVVAFSLFGFAPKDGGPPYLFLKTDKQGTSRAFADRAVMSGINVSADLPLLGAPAAARIRIPLPDGSEITARRQRLERRQGADVWLGSIEGSKNGLVFFTSTGKALSGRIELGRRRFRAIYLGNGVHRVDELDLRKLNEVDNDGEVPKAYGKPRDRKDQDGCPDPASDIDVMVVYTQDAEDGAGGFEGMQALIYESLHLTNLAYENSDIAQRLHLVHHAKVAYTEASDSATDRGRLQDPSDGFMDGIHALRDAHGADLVMLITETAESGNCGRAFIMDPVSEAHEAFAFGVVRRDCAADNLSFPHELGHIMSARHQDDGNATPFAWGHGHFVTTPADGSGMGWETIMSKRSDCERQIFFSNPNQSFSPTASAATDPRGTAAQRDNHRVLNDTAATVANFRCSSPDLSNVWMKDRWEDTGLEPDPATAGLAMYRSPYIWVRRSQDPTFLAQHEHQDPLFGSTNWIYVKMHNGNMASQSGNLELYIADASISLSWPAGWTLVASIPATLPGSSTSILEDEWTNVPNPSGSTHYCMIARWVSATDPMTTPETSNIGDNVRANNNIVWRNLNVVDTDDDGDSHVVVNVAGARRSKLSRIAFVDQTLFPKPKFVNPGRVHVAIDDKLYSFWKSGGQKLSGLTDLGGGQFELSGASAYLDNIPLPADYRGLIKLFFKKSDQSQAGKYDFAVQHFVMDNGSPVLLGGVDYELIKK